MKKPVVPPPDIIVTSRAKNETLLQNNVLRIFCHPIYDDNDIAVVVDDDDNRFERAATATATAIITVRFYYILPRPYGGGI